MNTVCYIRGGACVGVAVFVVIPLEYPKVVSGFHRFCITHIFYWCVLFVKIDNHVCFVDRNPFSIGRWDKEARTH
jgi:hypothetical protein